MMRTRFFDAAVETMSAEERAEYQTRGLKRLLKRAYANCQGVRAILDSAQIKPKDIQSLEDLEKIPVTTKDELRELQQKAPPFGGFLAVPLSDLHEIYCSPGPLFEPHETSRAYWKRQAKVLYNAGIEKGDIVLCAYSSNLVMAGILVQTGANISGATVIPAGPGNTELQVQIAHLLGATVFVGTPSFFSNLISKAEEMGYNFKRDFRLRKALCGGEILSPSLREHLEGFGVNVTQFYGASDVGCFAYECQEKNGYHVCEETIAEIVDPASKKRLRPGELGEVVVTALDAQAYLMVRLGTGDISLYTDEPCACGRTSRRLIRIVGRVGEAARVRGMFLYPKQIDEMLSHFREISRWSAVVSRPKQRDELIIKVELAAGAGTSRQIEDTIFTRFPEICHVKPDRVEFVSPGSIPDAQVNKVVDQRTWK
jgi:phenylacetate-CoA ligase